MPPLGPLKLKRRPERLLGHLRYVHDIIAGIPSIFESLVLKLIFIVKPL